MESTLTGFAAYVWATLQKLPRRAAVSRKGAYATLLCLYHDDHSPSMHLNLKERRTGKRVYHVGDAICYACGTFKCWRELMDDWKMQVRDGVSFQEEHADINLFSSDENVVMVGGSKNTTPPLDAMIRWNEQEDWRGISGRLLTRCPPARLTLSEAVERMQIYLPCFVDGDYVGGIYGNLEKRGKRNYWNTPGSWSADALFPHDYSRDLLVRRRLRTAVVVEGPRDALRLIQYGIPAFATLGAGQWTGIKQDLLAALPIDRLITCMDPDEEGDRATARINTAMQDFVQVKRFRMMTNVDGKGTDEDPGNMAPDRIAQLKEHVYTGDA